MSYSLTRVTIISQNGKIFIDKLVLGFNAKCIKIMLHLIIENVTPHPALSHANGALYRCI